MLGRALRLAKGQVREAVDRRRRVAELVGRARGHLAQVGEVARQRHARLEAPHLGEVREERHDAEKAAIGALRRRRGHAEDLLRVAPPQVDLAPSHGRALAPDTLDRVAKIGSVGQQRLHLQAAHGSRSHQDLAARLVQLHHRAGRIDREEACREVARERAGRGLQIVGAPLLGEREPFQLALFLGERLDRGLEPRDHEVALVGVLEHGRSRRRSGRGQQPVVGLEQ